MLNPEKTLALVVRVFLFSGPPSLSGAATDTACRQKTELWTLCQQPPRKVFCLSNAQQPRVRKSSIQTEKSSIQYGKVQFNSIVNQSSMWLSGWDWVGSQEAFDGSRVPGQKNKRILGESSRVLSRSFWASYLHNTVQYSTALCFNCLVLHCTATFVYCTVLGGGLKECKWEGPKMRMQKAPL